MSDLLFSGVKIAEVEAGEKSGSNLDEKSGSDLAGRLRSNDDLALYFLDKMSDLLNAKRNPAPTPSQEVSPRRPSAHAHGSCVSEPSWMRSRGIGS